MKPKYGKFVEEEENNQNEENHYYNSDFNEVNTGGIINKIGEDEKYDELVKQANNSSNDANDFELTKSWRNNKSDNDESFYRDNNDASAIDLMPQRPSLLKSQNISIEEDISEYIYMEKEETKKNEGNFRTFQLKLNDNVNFLSTTTVKQLKEKLLKEDIDMGKSVRLLFMGKMMQDNDLLEKYKLFNKCFLNAIVTFPLNRPEGAQPADGQIESTDGKIGLDRFLRMPNKQYTDLQVHQMRLALHSILMRSGVEKTDETADGLLTNEEKWLNKEMPKDDYLLELIDKKTVLSWRNDIVLPIYYEEMESVQESFKSKDWLLFIFFAFIGLLIPVVSLLFVTLLLDLKHSQVKSWVVGNIIAALLLLLYA